MTYEFERPNVIPGCEGKVRGETKVEVLQAAQHANDVRDMPTLSDDVVEKVKASIHATA